MSPTYYKCTFCGILLGCGMEKWVKEIRLLYVNGHQWNDVTLSGVGWYAGESDDYMGLAVPRNSNARYDDASVDKSTSLDVIGMTPYWDDGFRAPRSAADTDDIEAEPWGFHMHQSCWILFTKKAGCGNIDLQTLMRIFRSFPTSPGLLHWGHDYGGLFELPGQSEPMTGHIPRLGGYKDHVQDIEWRTSDPYLDDRCKMDPLSFPEFSNFTKRDMNVELSPKPTTRNFQRCVNKTTFDELPYDVREQVLYSLSSRDICNLRLASRSFASMYLSQLFWRSRFTLEYEYIFEAQQQTVDFKSLYLALRYGTLSRTTRCSLANRKRIWTILESIASLLDRFEKVELQGRPLATVWEPDLTGDDKDYLGLSLFGNEINDTRFSFSVGSTSLFKRKVDIEPDHLTRLDVHMVTIFNYDYVTGIRFVHDNGYKADLGYLIDGKVMSHPLSTTTWLHGIVGFQGFLALVTGASEEPSFCERKRQGWHVIKHAISPKSTFVMGHFDGLRLLGLYFPTDKNDRTRRIKKPSGREDGRKKIRRNQNGVVWTVYR